MGVLAERLAVLQTKTAEALAELLSQHEYPKNGTDDGSFASIIRLSQASGINAGEFAEQWPQYSIESVSRWCSGLSLPLKNQKEIVEWIKRRLRAQ